MSEERPPARIVAGASDDRVSSAVSTQDTISARDTIAYWLAVWFGIGRLRFAPGTIAAMTAWAVQPFLDLAGNFAQFSLVAVVTCCAIWSSHRTAERMQQKDPQFIVIDEVAGALVALSLAGKTSLLYSTAALVLFRALDILKPWPINAAEHLRPAGLGIVADDVVAGVAAGLTVYLVRVLLS